MDQICEVEIWVSHLPAFLSNVLKTKSAPNDKNKLAKLEVLPSALKALKDLRLWRVSSFEGFKDLEGFEALADIEGVEDLRTSLLLTTHLNASALHWTFNTDLYGSAYALDPFISPISTPVLCTGCSMQIFMPVLTHWPHPNYLSWRHILSKVFWNFWGH